jgi:hypothetical protein
MPFEIELEKDGLEIEYEGGNKQHQSKGAASVATSGPGYVRRDSDDRGPELPNGYVRRDSDDRYKQQGPGLGRRRSSGDLGEGMCALAGIFAMCAMFAHDD